MNYKTVLASKVMQTKGRALTYRVNTVLDVVLEYAIQLWYQERRMDHVQLHCFDLFPSIIKMSTCAAGQHAIVLSGDQIAI